MECLSKRPALSGPCTHGKMSVSSMPSAHCLARLSGRCATGGAKHFRSSLLMVLEDTATVSTAKVASSGPPEDRESLSSASTQTLARSQWVCVPVDDCATLKSCSTFARVGRCLQSKIWRRRQSSQEPTVIYSVPTTCIRLMRELLCAQEPTYNKC